MDRITNEAVEAVKVALVLFERYRRDAASLASDTTISLDERLLSLDQSYQGVWEQLDRAAALLKEQGRNISVFEDVRQEVRDAHQGYKQRDEVSVSLGGVEAKRTYWVSAARFKHIEQALKALQALLPFGESFALERDADVDQFLRDQRSARQVLKPLIGFVVVAGGVAAALLLFQWLRPTDYGPRSPEIYAEEAALERKPCDKERIVKLAELLNEAKAYGTTLERARAFFKRCGDHRRLRWATYAAHKRSGDFAGAAAEATRLIKAVPRDRDYRWWRAEAYEGAGDVERAIVDYRQAVALEPFVRNLPFSLAGLLERVGRPCEALFWLRNYAHHHPELRRRLVPRTTRLRSTPECRKLAGTGSLTIPLVEGDRVRVAVTINDRATREMIVYPDALYLMISSRLAKEVGLDPAAGTELLIRTAEGFFETRLLTAGRVSLGPEGQARSVDVPLAVGDELPLGAEGIVGQSLLSRFTVVTGGDPPTLRLAPLAQP
ncbi:MAG: hypothetical protein JRI55_40925 [Deltaproteobacteria bacterium]|jgi:tetratricopeptide (TPR) repeat protein|nr:hypothetical protein [Deltaproteobacteria bacterium]